MTTDQEIVDVFEKKVATYHTCQDDGTLPNLGKVWAGPNLSNTPTIDNVNDGLDIWHGVQYMLC